MSGSSDKSVRVWDALTGVEWKKLTGHTDLINSVAFSSNGTRIVSGSHDHSVRLWDVSTGILSNVDAHFDWHPAGSNWIIFSGAIWYPQRLT